MAITQENAQLAVCDACSSRKLVHEVDDVEGVYGEVMVVGSWGGYPVKFYSCQPDAEHVGVAYYNAALLAREENGFSSDISLTSNAGDFSLANPHVSPSLKELAEEILGPTPPTPYRVKRPSARRNPKSDNELRGELAELWITLGAKPSHDRAKKYLKVGSARAHLILDTTPDPT
jgi:hypothetical protein